MIEPDILEKVKVREVTRVFASRAAATPAVGDLLRAGFDRADIDVIAEGERLVKRLGDVPAPAEALADVPKCRDRGSSRQRTQLASLPFASPSRGVLVR